MNPKLAVALASEIKSLSKVYHERGIVGEVRGSVDSGPESLKSGIDRHDFCRCGYLDVACGVNGGRPGRVTNLRAVGLTLSCVRSTTEQGRVRNNNQSEVKVSVRGMYS